MSPKAMRRGAVFFAALVIMAGAVQATAACALVRGQTAQMPPCCQSRGARAGASAHCGCGGPGSPCRMQKAPAADSMDLALGAVGAPKPVAARHPAPPSAGDVLAPAGALAEAPAPRPRPPEPLYLSHQAFLI